MKPTNTLTLKEGEVISINGLLFTSKMIERIGGIISTGQPIETIQTLTVKMTDALLDRESDLDAGFVSVILSVNDILTEYERIKHLTETSTLSN